MAKIDDDRREFADRMAEVGELKALGALARPLSDDDWGSERQIEAENAFFAAVEVFLSARDMDTWECLCNYCNKATSDEMIDEALRLVDLHA